MPRFKAAAWTCKRMKEFSLLGIFFCVTTKTRRDKFLNAQRNPFENVQKNYHLMTLIFSLNYIIMEIVFASTKRVKYGKSKLKSPFVIWKMRLQRPQSYCILIAKWLFLRNRDDSIGKEEELLSLQTKNLEMHSTSLVQSTKVLNKISEAEKQLESFHVHFLY